MPSIRPLETLHNALSLRQLDAFLEYVTATIFKTPCPSPRLRSPLADKKIITESVESSSSFSTNRNPSLSQTSRQSSEYKRKSLLKLRKYNNNSIQSEFLFEIAALFHHLYGEGKTRQFQNWNFLD